MSRRRLQRVNLTLDTPDSDHSTADLGWLQSAVTLRAFSLTATCYAGYDEFSEVNELGLAFGFPESIVYEDVQDCLRLLGILKSAAAEMLLDESVVQLERKMLQIKESADE